MWLLRAIFLIDERQLHSFGKDKALRDISTCASELKHMCTISCHAMEVGIIQITIENRFATLNAFSCALA